MAKCSICKIEKDLSNFGSNKQNKSGIESRCRLCRHEQWKKKYYSDIDKYRKIGRETSAKHRDTKRAYTRKSYVEKQYKISVSELNNFVDKYVLENGSHCEICGKEADIVGRVKQKSKRRLVVDHCHKTGKLRGMLCDLCNTAIGKLGDDITLLEKAIKYLKKHD